MKPKREQAGADHRTLEVRGSRPSVDWFMASIYSIDRMVGCKYKAITAPDSARYFDNQPVDS